MDTFDKFFVKYGYKFPKGYPDMNNEQDILLMESILEQILNESISLIPEASETDAKKAIEILKSLPQSSNEKIFPISPPNLSNRFDGARKAAEIHDFHFHDLRHMAITRMAKKLPNLIELSSVSGHKSLKMLQRYYHPDAEELARKLD